MDFNVFTSRVEVGKKQHISELQILASTITNFQVRKESQPWLKVFPNLPNQDGPSRAFFQSHQNGHCARECPLPGIFPKPCLPCGSPTEILIAQHWQPLCHLWAMTPEPPDRLLPIPS